MRTFRLFVIRRPSYGSRRPQRTPSHSCVRVHSACTQNDFQSTLGLFLLSRTHLTASASELGATIISILLRGG
jgi:hypothetical protein